MDKKFGKSTPENLRNDIHLKKSKMVCGTLKHDTDVVQKLQKYPSSLEVQWNFFNVFQIS